MSIRLIPIIARLEAETGQLFRSIDGVAGLAAIEEQHLRPPMAFVAPEREGASGNERVGAVRQVITPRVAVVIVVAGQARQGAGAINEELAERAEAVKAALIGWVYPGAQSATLYRGGRLLRAADGILAWQIDVDFEIQFTNP